MTSWTMTVGSFDSQPSYLNTRAPSPELGDLLLDTVDFSENESEPTDTSRLGSDSFVESAAMDSKRVVLIAKDKRCNTCKDTKKNPGIKIIVECGHFFHYMCIKEELAKKNPKCPTCAQESKGPRIIAKMEKLEVKRCRTLCGCFMTSTAIGAVLATTLYFTYLRGVWHKDD